MFPNILLVSFIRSFSSFPQFNRNVSINSNANPFIQDIIQVTLFAFELKLLKLYLQQIWSFVINSFSFPTSPLNLGRVLTFTERIIVTLTRSFIITSPSLSLFSSRVLTSTSSGFFNFEASSFSKRTLREPLTLLVLDILIKFRGFGT